jgi:hypothetical protein
MGVGDPSVLLCLWSSAFRLSFFSLVPSSPSPLFASSVVPGTERKAEDAQHAGVSPLHLHPSCLCPSCLGRNDLPPPPRKPFIKSTGAPTTTASSQSAAQRKKSGSGLGIPPASQENCASVLPAPLISCLSSAPCSVGGGKWPCVSRSPGLLLHLHLHLHSATAAFCVVRSAALPLPPASATVTLIWNATPFVLCALSLVTNRTRPLPALHHLLAAAR